MTKGSSGHFFFFVLCVLKCIHPGTGLHTILKLNYSKHARPIIAIIEINKQAQAQSEINHVIITNLLIIPPHTHANTHSASPSHPTSPGCQSPPTDSPMM